MAAADRFLIDGLGYGQTAVAAQMVLQKVGKIRHHVSHYQNTAGKTRGQTGNDHFEDSKDPTEPPITMMSRAQARVLSIFPDEAEQILKIISRYAVVLRRAEKLRGSSSH